MLVVTRHRVPEWGVEAFLDAAGAALEVLAERPGYLGGRVGRAADDPELWAVVTEWRDVRSYRWALSAYEVKIHAVPLLSTALDEPSAYEIVLRSPADPHAPVRPAAQPASESPAPPPG